jgi:transposase
MTITDIDSNIYSTKWKGLHYGKTAIYDQVAAGCGKAGLRNSPTESASLLRPSLTTRFHPGPDFRNTAAASILPDRLPRHRWYSRRFFGYHRDAGTKEAAALHNPAKGPASAVKKNIFQGLLAKIFDTARCIGLINKQDGHACIDSTGLEDHFVSRHFIMRQNCHWRRYRRWVKLTIVCHSKTHLIAGALVSKGPSTDCHNLAPTVEQALDNMPIDTLLADCGYDSESNHRLCRDRLGISWPVIAVNPRNLKYGSMTGHFRRMMRSRFPQKKYRQRWQVESIFSRLKRRLGYCMRARTDESRQAECFLRVLTYNLMILYIYFLKRAYHRSFLQSTLKIDYWNNMLIFLN